MDRVSAERMETPGRRILYLSYDGMSDQLGQSQVLPYLAGLTGRGHRISLISFEKSSRSDAEIDAARRACDAAGVDWHPLPYHKRPPILSSLYDLLVMRRQAERLQRQSRFDWVHCRSYLPALVGLAMKRRHGLRFLFDMRGFWADERVDGGLWDLKNPLFRAVFRYFKRKESELLREADHIVSLTEQARRIMLERPDRAVDGPPISVIPCCVDFNHFRPVAGSRRETARNSLGIAAGQRVAAYLGSIGTWYMLDEMLDFFRVQLERDPGALLLMITRDDPAPILAAAEARGVPRDAVTIGGATRDEVPLFTSAADYGLFFIRPTFSKAASCPTKLGEFLALEIPVVTNGGVGDVAEIVEDSGAGVLVKRFDEPGYRDALDRLERLELHKDQARQRARIWFDLDSGVERYDAIYREAATDWNSSTSRGACEASE